MSRGLDNVMDYDSGGLERNCYLDVAWGLRSKNIAPIAAGRVHSETAVFRYRKNGRKELAGACERERISLIGTKSIAEAR